MAVVIDYFHIRDSPSPGAREEGPDSSYLLGVAKRGPSTAHLGARDEEEVTEYQCENILQSESLPPTAFVLAQSSQDMAARDWQLPCFPSLSPLSLVYLLCVTGAVIKEEKSVKIK